MRKRKKVTLMPVIALMALGLMVALPTLSSTVLHAASATHYAAVTVRSGDTLWSIASAHTASTGNIQETIDHISDANHLASAPLQPGQRLLVPTTH